MAEAAGNTQLSIEKKTENFTLKMMVEYSDKDF